MESPQSNTNTKDVRHVLVTGAAGFVGRRLCEMAYEKYGPDVQITALIHKENFEDPRFRFVRGDINSEEDMMAALKDVDVVFHSAALIEGSKEDMTKVNLGGTQNLLKCCMKQGVKKFIFVSSASVVFEGVDIKGADETSPYSKKHLDYYTYTKQLAEMEVIKANGGENGTPEGLLTCSIRPHTIYGPRDKLFWPAIIDKAMEGKMKFVMGTGQTKVDTTYVDNCVHACLLAEERLSKKDQSPAGQCYFVSDDNPISFWDFIKRICVEVVGLNPSEVGSKKLGFGFMKTVAAVTEFFYFFSSKTPPITTYRVALMCTDHWFNIEKAKKELDYKPVYDHETAAKMTVEWFKENYMSKKKEGNSKEEKK